MKMLVGFICLAVALPVLAQERRADEIDPNTKIQGGADVRGSGANAGATAAPEKRIDEEKDKIPVEKRAPDQDKPTSERKEPPKDAAAPPR